MDENFQKILDDIKSSAKTVKVLPCDCSARERVRKKYEINPQSLLGRLLESCNSEVFY